MADNNRTPLIEVKDLKEYFNINVGLFKSKPLKAVDGVSFAINKGETLGLVADLIAGLREYSDGTGKWVRYDENGHMIKGWYTQDGKTWYYDLTTGAMYKGWHTIEGSTYHFDETTGVKG